MLPQELENYRLLADLVEVQVATRIAEAVRTALGQRLVTRATHQEGGICGAGHRNSLRCDDDDKFRRMFTARQQCSFGRMKIGVSIADVAALMFSWRTSVWADTAAEHAQAQRCVYEEEMRASAVKEDFFLIA